LVRLRIDDLRRRRRWPPERGVHHRIAAAPHQRRGDTGLAPASASSPAIASSTTPIAMPSRHRPRRSSAAACSRSARSDTTAAPY
jgi:hypothetical protein